MNFAYFYYDFVSLLGGGTATIVTLIFFIKKRLNNTAHIFRLTCMCSAIWSFGFFGVINAETENHALIWRWAMEAGSILIPALWLHFVLSFLSITGKKKNILIVVYLISIFLWVWNYLELIIPGIFTKGMSGRGVFKFYAEAGLGYYLYFLFFFSLM